MAGAVLMVAILALSSDPKPPFFARGRVSSLSRFLRRADHSRPRPLVQLIGDASLDRSSPRTPARTSGAALVSSSRSMLLCYAIASMVNAVVLGLAAIALSVVRSVPLPETFAAVYVAAGTFARPAKVSLALAMCPLARRRTDALSWPRFSLIFVPFFTANLAITAFAHGKAALWLWGKVLQPLLDRSST